MVINFNFLILLLLFYGRGQHELLSGRKVYNGMMSLSLEESSGKAFLKKKHLGSALKDVSLTRWSGHLEACQTDGDGTA